MPKVIGAHKQTQSARNATRIHLASSGDISAGTANVKFSFPDGYDLFQIVYVDVHPSVTETKLSFQVSTDGSNYNNTIRSCAKRAQRREDNTDKWAGGQGGSTPLSDETLYQQIILQGEAGDADAGASGELWFYNPRGTTYQKMFHGECAHSYGASVEYVNYLGISGYIATTSALADIDFRTTVQEGDSLDGNLDDGFIDLYGWVT